MKIDKEGIPKRLWYIFKSACISILVVLLILVYVLRFITIPVCLGICSFFLFVGGLVISLAISVIFGIVECAMWSPIYYILYGKNWFKRRRKVVRCILLYKDHPLLAEDIFEDIAYFLCCPFMFVDELREFTKDELDCLWKKVISLYPKF